VGVHQLKCTDSDCVVGVGVVLRVRSKRVKYTDCDCVVGVDVVLSWCCVDGEEQTCEMYRL